MILLAVAALTQASPISWQPVPAGTKVPVIFLVCHEKGQPESDFKSAPWWQLFMVRNATTDKIMIEKVRAEEPRTRVAWKDALVGYETQDSNGERHWRLTYKDDKTNSSVQVINYSPVHWTFTWNSQGKSFEGVCDGPPPPLGPDPLSWATDPKVWK